jgi:hypothetical protein
MKVNTIDEPYKSEIVEIMKNENDSTKRLHKLKIYMLENEYFKSLYTDVGWLAYCINSEYNNCKGL